MSKTVAVVLLCVVAVGCANTRTFMGSYDTVKITVSANQAQMSAENFPYEVQSSGGKSEGRIFGRPICIDKTNSYSCKAGDIKDKLQVTIVCSDEKLIREFSDNFCKGGFAVEKRFHKPGKESTVISEVTIYPKRKSIGGAEGDYHLIEFETMGGLSGGRHRVLIKDPLAFVFWPMNITTDTSEIEMFITHLGYIKGNKFVVKDNIEIIHINEDFQILSKIISITRIPVKIIFSRMS